MTAFRAFGDGLRRVVSAPSVLVLVWATTVVVSLPATMTIRAAVIRSLGRSLDAADAAQGMNYEWMREFPASVVGFSATLDNLSALLDRVERPPAVVVTAAIYVVAWMFLSGGVLSRYAHARAPFVPGFFAACRAYFFRFLRLGIIAAIVYGALFGALHPWMFGSLYTRLTSGVDLEQTQFLIRAGLYLAFVLLLAAVNIGFDYAKVRTVVDGRRSVVIALGAACRFIRKHPAAAIGVYLLNVLLFLLVIAGYAMVAPPGGGTGVMVWPAFAIGQAYIVGRLAVRLLFWASEASLFLGVSGD